MQSTSKETYQLFQGRQYSVIPRFNAKEISEMQKIIKREKATPIFCYNTDEKKYQEINQTNILNIGSGGGGTGSTIDIYTVNQNINLTAGTPYFINLPFSMTDLKSFFSKAFVGNDEVNLSFTAVSTTQIKVETNLTGDYTILVLAF
jgi:hypothetical protein